MKFREEKLWTLDVDDVLKVNIEGLRQIQEYYWTIKQRYMSKRNAIDLVTKDSAVQVTDKDAMYCYGMSKMTLIDEVKQSKRYVKMELPELCEFLGRVADIKYKDQTNFTLGQKIEFVLDDIFRLINYRRNEKNLEADEVSDSDSDY